MEFKFEDDVFEVTEIGNLSKGIDGTDTYLHVRCLTDDVSSAKVAAALLPRYYDEGHGPGSYFCRNVDVMNKPYCSNEYIAIVYGRYDV